MLCRHGIDNVESEPRPPRMPGPLRIGFLGRWDRVKGIDTLLAAMQRLPINLDIELHIHALAQGEDGLAYRRQVEAMAGNDPRIRFNSPLAPEQILNFLRNIDVLAVPSRCLETGPLVVLEAFAAGTPVLGSALGGIREWVIDGENGWLIPHDDVEQWASAIRHIADAEVLPVPQCPQMTVERVACEMQQIYSDLLIAA